MSDASVETFIVSMVWFILAQYVKQSFQGRGEGTSLHLAARADDKAAAEIE